MLYAALLRKPGSLPTRMAALVLPIPQPRQAVALLSRRRAKRLGLEQALGFAVQTVASKTK